MSWGFEATNDSGQVLISSDTKNLHYVGKATLNRIIRQFDGYGGLRHYAFWIDCNATPMPFFTMPTSDYYGIVAVRQINPYIDRVTWEIEVIRSGVSDSTPEVYVFSDPLGIPTQVNIGHGMQVFRGDGSLSFDSRIVPLVVTGGIAVAPPSNPLIVGPSSLSGKYCESNPDGAMAPDNSNTYTFTVPGEKPIYFYSSIAQAEREFNFSVSEEECDGVDAYGNCVGAKRIYSWNSYYWAFYRGGINCVGGSIFAGWITAQFGCHWTYDLDSSFIGIGTGGNSGGAGQWPYSNETLNLTASSVITADGSRYD